MGSIFAHYVQLDNLNGLVILPVIQIAQQVTIKTLLRDFVNNATLHVCIVTDRMHKTVRNVKQTLPISIYC